MAVSIGCVVGTQFATDMFVDGFGLGNRARVQEDPTGTLGGEVTGTISNNGSTPIPASYTVEATVTALGLRVVGGNATFAPGRTLFTCAKSGPRLAPGQSITMAFMFGAGGCPPFPFAALPCGLYRERITIRGVDASGRRFVKKCTLYIYVPSAVRDIDLIPVVNPDNLPLTPPSPPGFIDIGGDDRFNFIAPFYPPNPRPFTGAAVRVTILGAPPNSLFVLNGKGRTDVTSGANTFYQPALPIGQPAGVMGPQTVDYVLNVPNTGFNQAPCTHIAPEYYEAKLDGLITVMSVEYRGTARIMGCVIKQATLKVSALFECR